MKFKTTAEAFNFYNAKTIEEIEERASTIKQELENNPELDIEGLNIEIDGLNEAKQNILEKRDNIMEFNPLTNETTEKKFDLEQRETVFNTIEYRDGFYKSLLGKDLLESEKRALEIASEVTQSEKRLDAFNTSTSNANVIPTLTLNEVIKKAQTQGGLIAHARQFNVPSNLAIPVVTPLEMAEWHTEGEEVDAETNIPTKVEFNAYEIIKIFSQSVKARKMSIQAFEAYIVDQLVQSVMNTIANALVNGTGNAKGLASVTFTTDTNQLEYTGTPEYTDFTKLMALVKRGYAQGGAWIMNNSTLFSKVYSVVDGNNRPIFIENAQKDSVGYILGYPVIIDDFIEGNEIIFGNPQYLGYNLPDGVVLEISNESSFKKGLIDYRALAIADTQVLLPEAFVKLTEA